MSRRFASLAPLMVAMAGSASARAEAVDQAKLLADLSQTFPGGMFTPVVGQWVVYRIGPEPFRFWRVAILGKAPTSRGEGYWMEIDVGPVPLGGALSLKILAVGDPRDGTQVERAFFRLGGGIVQELDPAALGRIHHDRSPAPNVSMQPTIPAQDYTTRLTHAGSFRSVKIDNGEGITLWLSPEAPVFHIVSVVAPERNMDVFAFGDQALDTMGEPSRKISVKPQLEVPVAAVDGGAR